MATPGNPVSDHQELSGVSTHLRIPPIWRDRLRLWFAQFEAIVSPHKKGDKAMYELVVGQLERQDIDEIADIILRPPENNKYDAIKNRLLQVYEESEQRQVQRLLSEMELGEMKPSQLLRRMKNLAGENISESTLRIMWTNHLPQSIRAVLAVSENIANKSDINDLASMADKILEHSRPEVSAIAMTSSQHTSNTTAPSPHSTLQSSTHTEQLQSDLASLHSKIDILTRELAELKAQQLTREIEELRSHRDYQQRRPRWDNSNRPRSPSNTRAPRSSTPQRYDTSICYYHRKFGKQAYRCTHPCKFEDSQPTAEN